MDILAKLFSSGPLVKIMRLFLFNPEEVYDTDLIRRRTKCSAQATRIEVRLLERIGFLKKKVFIKFTEYKNGKTKKKRTSGWTLDATFPYIGPLHSLLVNTELVTDAEIMKRLKGVGAIKLVIVSGVFLQDEDSRVDLLIVGNNLKKTALERAMKALEADIGTELRYTAFDTDEFKYRLGVYDKLVRDILDYPHHIIVDKVGV